MIRNSSVYWIIMLNIFCSLTFLSLKVRKKSTKPWKNLILKIVHLRIFLKVDKFQKKILYYKKKDQISYTLWKNRDKIDTFTLHDTFLHIKHMLKLIFYRDQHAIHKFYLVSTIFLKTVTFAYSITEISLLTLEWWATHTHDVKVNYHY